MSDLLGKRPAGDDAPKEAAPRKKKQGGRAAQAATVEVRPTDFVHIVPVRRAGAENERAGPVLLSKANKAAALQLSDDRLSVTGHQGFRSVRATHGAHEGTWYCEVTVAHLGGTGHARLGWATKKSDVNTPVGFDQYGVSYRDVDGSKVHKAWREPYGAPFKEGDVVGLLLHMPAGGRPHETGDQDIVRFKGGLYVKQDDQADPEPLPGSLIGFTLNGAWQGAAQSDILQGTYYPSASLFTDPQQSEGATVTFNFGPDFKFGPPSVEGLSAARPVCELSPAQGQQQQQLDGAAAELAQQGGQPQQAASAQQLEQVGQAQQPDALQQ